MKFVMSLLLDLNQVIDQIIAQVLKVSEIDTPEPILPLRFVNYPKLINKSYIHVKF